MPHSAPASRAAEVSRAPGPLRRHATGLTLIAGISLAALSAGHALVPDVLGIGLLWDTALPWTWVLLPLLLIVVLVARTRGAAVGLLAPALVWTLLFGPGLVPLGDSRASVPDEASLSVASQNLGPNGDPAALASSLASSGADLIALEEIDGQDRDPVSEALDTDYPYSALTGTVGLWSRYPIDDSLGLTLGLDWYRAINAVVDTPSGAVSVYVIHADSARPGDHAERDTMLAELADAVASNTRGRVVVVGDLNASGTDRALAPLQAELTEPAQSGGGFGFTWPAEAPVVRLDHVFVRGMTPTSNSVTGAGSSDHRGIVASFRLDG